jgi:hypothetical protein
MSAIGEGESKREWREVGASRRAAFGVRDAERQCRDVVETGMAGLENGRGLAAARSGWASHHS